MAEDCISQCIVLQLPGKQLLVEVLAELKRLQPRAHAAELLRRLHQYLRQAPLARRGGVRLGPRDL